MLGPRSHHQEMAELRLEPRCVHLTIHTLHQPPIPCSTGHRFESGSATDSYVTLGKTFISLQPCFVSLHCKMKRL